MGASLGWVMGSERNFEASQTERQRKTKKDRRESGERLKHLCARLGTADCLCQNPARPGESPEHRPSPKRWCLMMMFITVFQMF